MKIHQFQNQNLSHFSYAILEENTKEIVLIDPSRDIDPYLDWAGENKARIKHVIETHPHADFVSSHLEIYQRTGAQIHVSTAFGALFPHHTFDTGNSIHLGEINLLSYNTPGHSPDSICILLRYQGKDHSLFTGDTLFIGDCGRPDLREIAGSHNASREELALEMYHSLRKVILPLQNDVLVYPAHGAGSLCGKSLSSASSSTVGAEKIGNWSLQESLPEEFIKTLLSDQPFMPAYFGYDVDLNQHGAPIMKSSLQKIPYLNRNEEDFGLDKSAIMVDTRKQDVYNSGHYPNSFNIMAGNSFSTWLGSIIKPHEPFYILAGTEKELDPILIHAADIGYDAFLLGFLTIEGLPFEGPHVQNLEELPLDDFILHPEGYTILDVRNPGEVKEKIIFQGSLSIPLFELRDRLQEIPLHKPIVVHCAAGYRSAAASSILRTCLETDHPIYDLGDRIKDFM